MTVEDIDVIFFYTFVLIFFSRKRKGRTPKFLVSLPDLHEI